MLPTLREPVRKPATGATTATAVMAKVAAFGIAGWAAENLLYGPRYSAVFQGHKVPFLPVYAAGGLAVIAAAPALEQTPWPARGALYALMLGGLEYAGCQLDRKMFRDDGRAWDYGKIDGLAKASEGCVNWKHSILWGGLGLLAEKLA